jgi:gamma-glutamyl:cysteine ligase YbdK (ATP-grasp superfamily)
VNASLVPEKTVECLKDAPDVIASYYRAVKEEKDVREFFDLDVVDADSLVELHNALYRAVDFKELKVENVTCLVVSVNMVACRYGYSAVLVKDGTEKSIQRQYVTFLSGESCKIVWTEGEG